MSKIYLVLIFTFCWRIWADSKEIVKFKFTNLVCNATDPDTVVFEKCLLKAVSRDEQYVSLKINILKNPNNNENLSYQFVKRENGWKPFLYSGAINCDFRTKIYGVNKIMWNNVKKFTNMNHSCPYKYGYVILNKLKNTDVPSKVMLDLPVPEGRYGLFVDYFINSTHRALVKFYGTIY